MTDSVDPTPSGARAFGPPRPQPAPPLAADAPVEIVVYYDFASSLCHVGHRVMSRMAPLIDELGIELVWIPIDLSTLLGWRRGHPVASDRRDHVRGIADVLGVPVQIPTRWLDSRAWHGLTLHQLATDRATGSRAEPTLRERVFTRVFDEGRPREGLEAALEMAEEFGLRCSEGELEVALDALDAWTHHAADQAVTGVPTFMLDSWPFGGIQEDATMESIFRRWAKKVRAERAGAG